MGKIRLKLTRRCYREPNGTSTVGPGIYDNDFFSDREKEFLSKQLNALIVIKEEKEENNGVKSPPPISKEENKGVVKETKEVTSLVRLAAPKEEVKVTKRLNTNSRRNRK